MATYFKKPSIEKAEQSVIMDRVLEQKKKELSPEDYTISMQTILLSKNYLKKQLEEIY
jgi:hypothetical protein